MPKPELVDGMYFKKPEQAPDFVLGKISIKWDKFDEWRKDQTGEWSNLEVLMSKAGKPYIKVSTWKKDEPV